MLYSIFYGHNYVYVASSIFENVTAKWNFSVQTISKVATIIKPKSVIIAFFSLPSLLWFWSFSGLGNLPFDAFSLKWLQISLGWF